MSKYDKYKESAFTHEEMQPMIIETDMTDIVERLRLIDPTLELRYCEDVTKLHEIGQWCHEAADEIERLREFVSGLACDCEGEQCKVYGEDYLRFDCGYRKARAALEKDK